MTQIPIIIWRRIDGANGRNWPGIVMVDPSAEMPTAVLAQECWEAMHKLNPVNALRIAFSRSARRQMEIMGHEVEVQAANIIYGRDRDAYRAAEAARMKAGYGGLFDDMTRAQLLALMEARSDEARRWVRLNFDNLERWNR